MNMEELLDNNSNEMRTVVETFVIEESAELIYDGEALDNWNKLVEELGLQGQTQIVKKEKSPIPFMHLKKNLVEVFGTLCPCKTDVKEYKVTPIPLEILRLVSLSVNEKYFDAIQIWYDDKTPDPVCIGIKAEWYALNEKGNWGKSFPTKEEAKLNMDSNGISGEPYMSTWSAEHYLLGKWADVKRSFSDLINMATSRYIQEKGHEYRKSIKDTQRKLDDLETEAFGKFGTSVNGNDSESLPF